MKKTIMTIAIVLMMGTTLFAQQSGGMMRRSQEYEEARNANRMGSTRGSYGLTLPDVHGSDTDSNGVPLGSGIVVLVGFGAAYLVGKKHKE
jgi:hypothetical protein